MSIKILELQKKEKLMLNLLLFLLTFSSVYSQESDFEEIIFRDDNGEPIDSITNMGNFFAMGDTLFVNIIDSIGYFLPLLSVDGGITWKNKKIALYGDTNTFNQIEPHPLSLEFRFHILEKGDTSFAYKDFDGNVIRKVSTNFPYNPQYANPINPELLIFNRPSAGKGASDLFYFSKDYGKTWYGTSPNGISSGGREIFLTFGSRDKESVFLDIERYAPDDMTLMAKDFLKYNLYKEFDDENKVKKIHPFRDKFYNFDVTGENEAIQLPWNISSEHNDKINNKYETTTYLREFNNEIFESKNTEEFINLEIDSIYNLNIDNDFKEKICFNRIENKFYSNDYIYNYTEINEVSIFNYLNPDNRVISLTHSKSKVYKRHGTSDSIVYIFMKFYIFSTSDNGKNWNYMGKYETSPVIEEVTNIFINHKNNKVYLKTRPLIYSTGGHFRILQSRHSILSAPQENNKTTNKVYFSGNNLIIENDEEPKESTIKIFDLGGRAILQKDILLQKGTNQIPLSSHINPNLYLVNIELTNSKINIYKLIKGE